MLLISFIWLMGAFVVLNSFTCIFRSWCPVHILPCGVKPLVHFYAVINFYAWLDHHTDDDDDDDDNDDAEDEEEGGEGGVGLLGH